MTLQEILNPKHTAILVVDVQIDFVSSEGKAAKKHGHDISHIQKTIDTINKLLDKARKIGLPVIFTKYVDGLRYRKGPGLRRFEKLEKKEENMLALEGTEGVDFYGVERLDDDKVIIKHNFCSFFETDLEEYLQQNNIKTIILCGVKTNACVETTARTAYHKGFYVVVPKECVATTDEVQNECSLQNIGRWFGDVVRLEEVLRKWS